jgi:pimeloyl-ACP methyl ester carboxylesterase
MRMQPTEFVIDGGVVRVWRGGEGPPLLLLHGGMTDARSHWAPIWDQLTARFTVNAPDWPGFGGSQPLMRPTYPHLIAWLERLSAALGGQPLTIVGNSFGGALARLYGAAHPNHVERLILLNGGGLMPLSAAARLILASPYGAWTMARRARAGMGAKTVERMFAHPEAMDPAFLAAAAASGEIYPILRHCLSGPQPKLAWPHHPTLILWGEADRHVPLATGEALAAEVPHAVFRPVPEAGHLPQVERPEVIARAILSFADNGGVSLP